MRISTKDWLNYINKLSRLSTTAGNKMKQWVAVNGFADTRALIEYANGLVTKYGEGSAELACQMYDAIAELEGVYVPAAEQAEMPTYAEVAKAVNGSLIQSPTGQLIDSVVERLVKRASADTTLKNAIRDGAQFAWIPSGDTCAFCITLASRGWQHASSKALKGGHAEHIHGHCDCQYGIRFSNNVDYNGYNPDDYYEKYKSYPGSPKDKINAMRRENYAKNREAINEQKREAYAIRNGNESKE